MPKLGCYYCEGESDPGWIETDNNGPIVSCPICNPDGDENRRRTAPQVSALLNPKE